MSPRAAKSRKSFTRSRVTKVDQEEDKLKISHEEAKEHSDVWVIKIPPGFNPEPIALQASVKEDEPSDDHGGVKREDEKPTNVKPEDTKQEHTKHEVKSKLTPTRLWERESDGQRYVPRPSPARKKAEDVVDAPDFDFEQENLPYEAHEPPPLPPPLPQASPQPQRQTQRHHRDGRTLAEVEVLLPRLEDVRRRQAARAAQAQREQRQPGGAAHAAQATRQNAVFIKPDPEDDVKPLDEHDPVEAREVLRTAVQNLRNPDAEVKKEMLLNDEFLLDALTWEGINYKYPIPLPKEVAEFQLCRQYISHLYGGSSQATSPRPREEMLEWHGLEDWMFLRLEFNPHAPTRPGHSGLFFHEEGQATDDWHEIRRTFVRIKSAEWVYMGQYQMKPGISLSTDLWKAQKSSVRKAWAKGILRAARWGKSNCIRIWFRKQRGADYELTKEDWDEGEAQIKWIRSQLTEQDVLGAFDRGEEEMGTYRMTCVGYDAEFIEVLVRNQRTWEEMRMNAEPGEPTQKRKGEGKQKRKGKGKGTGSKRKPIEIESEEEEEEDVGVKREVKVGSDDSYQAAPMAGLAGSSTGRPRRAAAMVKRQRTS